ncbi:hypothetical protein [Coraliomargarita parva]|uniref:pyroglutamyl-peptidase I family protein n=1 Tax=Coraliomargarita parva TaxID=3014050 RepID=UPI0022B3B924|nr:hypothetical protein [Coraliomargarita parva]
MAVDLIITTFGAFRGRSRNGSDTLGQALVRKGDPRLRVLDLPVLWGVVESQLLPAIAEIQPRVVLGLGEGEANAVRFETVAVNRREGLDERNTEPEHPRIDASGPERLQSRWPVSTETLLARCPAITISRDAGSFLCNNTLYRSLQSPVSFAAFLHLPPQGTSRNEDYLELYLAILQSLIDCSRVLETERV